MTTKLEALENSKKKWIQEHMKDGLPEPKPIEKMLYTVAWSDGYDACLSLINEQYKKAVTLTKRV